jgi:glycosyltransferase involved in cell wall biosynthesis
MRLVILTPSFLPSCNGMTFATLQHATMLTELGHQVSVVAACPREHIESVTRFLSGRGIDFLALDIGGSGLLSRPVVGDVRGSIEQIVRLAPQSVLVEGRYFWGYHLIPLLKDCGMRIALVSHGSSAKRFGFSLDWVARSVVYGLYCWSHEREILRALDAVAVLSAHEDDDRFRDARLYRRLGLSPVVVSNTSVESVAMEVRRTAAKEGKIRIAVVGDMTPLKNQMAAIDLAERNESISFVKFFFPAENDYSRTLVSRAQDRCISNFEYCAGLDREAIIRSLEDIDLILCLSKTEAQPLAIIDGLACGVPFLSTPVGCVPSMKGGVISEVSGMREVIMQLAGDARAMEELASEARRFFQAAHSERAVKPALAALIAAAVREVT